jgi:hypothetical protein
MILPMPFSSSRTSPKFQEGGDTANNACTHTHLTLWVPASPGHHQKQGQENLCWRKMQLGLFPGLENRILRDPRSGFCFHEDDYLCWGLKIRNLSLRKLQFRSGLLGTGTSVLLFSESWEVEKKVVCFENFHIFRTYFCKIK